MAAPAVGCTDKRGLTRRRPFWAAFTSPRSPRPSSPSRSFLSRFLGARGTPGSEGRSYPGAQAGAGCAGSQLCPRGFGRRHPDLGPPVAVPGGVSRAPGLLGSPCPETRLGVAFAPKVWFFALILRFLPRSQPLMDTVTRGGFLPRGLEPNYASNKLNWRAFSLGPFQSLPAKLSLRKTSRWQFYILLLSLQFIHPKSQLHGPLVIEGERA